QRVAVLRAGTLEQVGPAAELYDRPDTRGVAAALGAPPMNFLDGVVSGVDGHPALQTEHGVTVPLPPTAGASVGAGAVVTLGVRPERIMAHAGDLAAGRLPLGDWTVIHAGPRGPAWLVTVTRPGLV